MAEIMDLIKRTFRGVVMEHRFKVIDKELDKARKLHGKAKYHLAAALELIDNVRVELSDPGTKDGEKED